MRDSILKAKSPANGEHESNFYNSARKPKRTSEFLKRIKEPQNNDSIINHCGSREGKGKNI
jgi:hypothetical protein